jgi:hypothetical protein
MMLYFDIHITDPVMLSVWTSIEIFKRFIITLFVTYFQKNRKLAEVTVRDTPLFDLHADNHRYKIGLILALYDYVSLGDEVEIVGFGRGVTTTHIFWAVQAKLLIMKEP